MPEAKVYFVRMKRLLSAASGSVASLLGIYVTLLGLVVNATSGAKLPAALFYGVLALLVVVWLIQSWFGYVRITHDPTWVMKLQETWDSPDTYRRRHEAAVTITQYRDKLSEVDKYETALSSIDDAIDVLEDVGFYVLGDQISPEAAHHHFYYWIQGYWSCAGPYILAIQKEKDPTRWRNIEPLFRVTSIVELERGKGRLRPENLILDTAQEDKFLSEESDLPTGSS